LLRKGAVLLRKGCANHFCLCVAGHVGSASCKIRKIAVLRSASNGKSSCGTETSQWIPVIEANSFTCHSIAAASPRSSSTPGRNRVQILRSDCVASFSRLSVAANRSDSWASSCGERHLATSRHPSSLPSESAQSDHAGREQPWYVLLRAPAARGL